jgi:hypothetical protein
MFSVETRLSCIINLPETLQTDQPIMWVNLEFLWLFFSFLLWSIVMMIYTWFDVIFLLQHSRHYRFKKILMKIILFILLIVSLSTCFLIFLNYPSLESIRNWNIYSATAGSFVVCCRTLSLC